MKTIRIFLLILIIIGISLLLTQKLWVPKLVSKILSNENGILVAAQKTTQVAGTFKDFTDAKSGFSFKYPDSWNAVSDSKKYSVCLNEDGNSACDIGVNILRAPDEHKKEGVVNNEDLILAFQKHYAGENITSKQNVVNGLHILTYASPQATEAFIETPTYDYNFIVSGTDEQGNIKKDFEQIKEALNSILTTVQVKTK